MIYSQKYVLVHFMQPLRDGVQFHMSEWPLHTTIADVFAIDRTVTNIDTSLAALLSRTAAVETIANEDATLGTTPVVLLSKTPSLITLHTDVISLLEENLAVFNTPEFTRSGFLPHVTIQKGARVYADDKVIIDSISLVDMLPDNDWEQRKVLTTFKLK